VKGAEVAILVVLVAASDGEPVLQPSAAEELARVGVTRVDIVRDNRTVALVAEGWSFDPDRSADAVVAAIGGRLGRVRKLRPVMHLAVSPTSALRPRVGRATDRRIEATDA
jgi:hypothetical protein